MMQTRIDRLDQTIVRLLVEDGRMSSTEIARRIGDVSERAVRYRIDRLIQEGVIRVRAIVNPKRMGLGVTADIFVEVEPGRVMEVAQKLARFECVGYVACSTGERDLSIQVYARDNEELYKFVTEVVGNVSGVRRTTTVLVPLLLKHNYEWQIPDSVCVDT